MMITMDTTWANNRDHDSSFGISDDENFTSQYLIKITMPQVIQLNENVNDVLTNIRYSSSTTSH